MFQLAPNVIIDSDEENEKEFLMDLESGSLFDLNYFAAMLVRMIEEGKDIEEYVEKVCELTNGEANPEAVRSDAEQYLVQMAELGLVSEA